MSVMSKKYLPFTEEERKRRVEDQRLGCVGIDDPGRWDATLRQREAALHEAGKDVHRLMALNRQLEEVLAGVTAERNAYKGAIHAMIWDSTLPNLIAHYRTRATLNFHQPIGEKFRTIIARLEAIRDLGVAPQPSGNSGGFAAAAGILADTWDGEPSEVTIRRLRDGTPAPETTKPIAETRMGEPNAIDAEEET